MSLAGCRLLLVDDDSDFLFAVARRFQRRNVDVAQCGLSTDAMDALTRQDFDVAIVDRTLPDGDGVSLARRLKEASPAISIIMLSGHAQPNAVARDACLAEYLVKPCGLGEIEAAVSRVWRCSQGAAQGSPDCVADSF